MPTKEGHLAESETTGLFMLPVQKMLQNDLFLLHHLLHLVQKRKSGPLLIFDIELQHHIPDNESLLCNPGIPFQKSPSPFFAKYAKVWQRLFLWSSKAQKHRMSFLKSFPFSRMIPSTYAIR